MLVADRTEADERAARALLDGSYRIGPQAEPDRLPRDLIAMPLAEALEKVADWLDDCDNHLALKRPGGLPTMPFTAERACVVVRIAARQAQDPATVAA